MKIFARLLFCTGIMLFMAPARAADDQQILAIVTELKVQQVQLFDNQSKIDAKLTDLATAIHEARIFMSRAGGPHKPPPPPK